MTGEEAQVFKNVACRDASSLQRSVVCMLVSKSATSVQHE